LEIGQALFLRPRAVGRQGGTEFVGAQVGGLAGKAVIDIGQDLARVDGGRALLQAQVDLRRNDVVFLCGQRLLTDANGSSADFADYAD
jgi:hypothetical protein